jgi:hypothetical protein
MGKSVRGIFPLTDNYLVDGSKGTGRMISLRMKI